jgi:hypothetical protein
MPNTHPKVRGCLLPKHGNGSSGSGTADRPSEWTASKRSSNLTCTKATYENDGTGHDRTLANGG